MNDKELAVILDEICSLVMKRIKNSDLYKNVVRRKNATVDSAPSSEDGNIGSIVNVKLPYDNKSFPARNETGYNLNKGDLVCIEYCIDLKNAVAVYKVK